MRFMIDKFLKGELAVVVKDRQVTSFKELGI